MSDQYNQVPFSGDSLPYIDAEFAENPEQRCPCILLLDTSGSMGGRPIDELNAGLQDFKNELMSDSVAQKRVEIALITFGPVKVVNDFTTADSFVPTRLTATGDTPIGAAIEHALSLLRTRKATYKQHGIEYYRPWVFLITDGAPTDNWQAAASLVHEGEAAKQFQFFAVGVKGANMEILSKISVRTPLPLDGLKFRELFAWLSNSLGAVSQSQLGDQVQLLAPSGWSTVG